MTKLEKEALQYDLNQLRKHIGKRLENIQVFMEAIEEEKRQMERERQMISILEAKENERTD